MFAKWHNFNARLSRAPNRNAKPPSRDTPVTTVYLESVVVKLPNTNVEFTDGIVALLDVLGQNENYVLGLTGSDQDYYPKLFVDFRSEHSDIITDFVLSNGEVTSVKVENSTGLSKPSPHLYKPVSVGTVNQRFIALGARLMAIDHVGFNLPWFSSDLHPITLQLRKELSLKCLYHKFPTGEAWDFIIPGDLDEIVNRKTVDYTQVRRPKFELVSFHKTSTPLIQFDVSVDASYERFLHLFPESLNDPGLRNIWVYLENPYTIDVCLVINEFAAESDWSDFFNGFRL